MRQKSIKIGYGIDINSIIWKDNIEKLLFNKFGRYLRLKYDNYIHEINYERHEQNRLPLSDNQAIHYFISNYVNNYGYNGIYGILCDIINEDKFNNNAIVQISNNILYICNENKSSSNKYKLLFSDGQIKNIIDAYLPLFTDSDYSYINIMDRSILYA